MQSLTRAATPDLSSASTSASDSCNVLSASLCKVVNADAYTLLLAIWASLQLTWVGMLLFVQFIQVTRGMTTYENMTGGIDRTATPARPRRSTAPSPARERP